MMTGIQLNQQNKDEHLRVLHGNNRDPYSQLKKEIIDKAVILNQKLDLIDNMDLTETARFEMGLQEMFLSEAREKKILEKFGSFACFQKGQQVNMGSYC
jgi:hypothetical protein